MFKKDINSELKHNLELRASFRKSAKKLNNLYKTLLIEKLKEIGNNPRKTGKKLKKPYDKKFSTRLTKKYRIIYSIPGYCKVCVEKLESRDKIYRLL